MKRTVLLIFLTACSGSSEPVTRDQLVATYLAMQTCEGLPLTVSECTTGLQADRDQLRCVAAAGHDCNQLIACFGGTQVAAPGCTNGATACEGSKFTVCESGQKLEIDCAAHFGNGIQCLSGSNGTANCAVGSCSADSTACSGGVVLACDTQAGLMGVKRICDPGQTCKMTDHGADCAGTGAACTDAQPRCDGTNLVQCANGFEARLDCAADVSGRGCFVSASQIAYCGFGTDCDPNAAVVDDCAGPTTLKLCVGGVVETVDCVAQGYRACDVVGTPLFSNQPTHSCVN